MIANRKRIRKGKIAMSPYQILIAEDDPVIRSQLQTLLRGNGYDTITADRPDEIIDIAGNKHPHLLLLDIKLPGESGLSVCSKIRTFSDLPIIFVTSCNTDMDELNSILLGGDAFITKPYNTAILLAKISALLKRAYEHGREETLRWQGATLHPESSTLAYQGSQIELTKNELKILVFLFRHAGKICSRNDLIDYLWDNRLYVDDNALSVNINRIREKLAAIDLTDFIKTRHRQGYTL